VKRLPGISVYAISGQLGGPIGFSNVPF